MSSSSFRTGGEAWSRKTSAIAVGASKSEQPQPRSPPREISFNPAVAGFVPKKKKKHSGPRKRRRKKKKKEKEECLGSNSYENRGTGATGAGPVAAETSAGARPAAYSAATIGSRPLHFDALPLNRTVDTVATTGKVTVAVAAAAAAAAGRSPTRVARVPVSPGTTPMGAAGAGRGTTARAGLGSPNGPSSSLESPPLTAVAAVVAAAAAAAAAAAKPTTTTTINDGESNNSKPAFLSGVNQRSGGQSLGFPWGPDDGLGRGIVMFSGNELRALSPGLSAAAPNSPLPAVASGVLDAVTQLADSCVKQTVQSTAQMQ